MPLVQLKDKKTMLEISSIQAINEIDKQAAQKVLVDSFIGEYKQYLNPPDIDKSLDAWFEGQHSVERYYKNYFDSEFTEFQEGKLDYWIEAKINGQLVGWATFILEGDKKDEAYMNLLIVDPQKQHQGIGKQLVHALTTLKLVPTLSAIHLLLRKKNEGGRIFYEKLGFNANPEYQRDNYVDVSLLEPFTYRHPTLTKQRAIHDFFKTPDETPLRLAEGHDFGDDTEQEARLVV